MLNFKIKLQVDNYSHNIQNLEIDNQRGHAL